MSNSKSVTNSQKTANAPETTSTAKRVTPETKTLAAPAVTPELRPSQTPVMIQRKSANEMEEKKKEEPTVQRRGVGGPAPSNIPSSVANTISSPGRSMDSPTRSFMESRFGRDFSGVRIHTGPSAAQSARDINAKAYTAGNHIAFDDGQYQPNTVGGRHLLAHELAHTVQQQGLQKMGSSIDRGPSDPLEIEADRVANAVMTGNPVALSSGTNPGLVISRRDWSTEPIPPGLTAVGVKNWSDPAKDADNQLAQVFNMGTFSLPGQKGPDVGSVKARWDERAAVDALEATITGGEPDKLLLKQERPDTEELRQIWFNRLGAPEDKVIARWNNEIATRYGVTGPLTDKFAPVTPGKPTAHMDHIVELQIGGNNVKENMQILDADQNVASGKMIYEGLKSKAQKIKAALAAKSMSVDKIILHFSDVIQAPYSFPSLAKSAYQIGRDMEANPPKADDDPTKGMEDYLIKAGSSTTLKVPPGTKAKTFKDPIPIAGSQFNGPASTLIPGMILNTLIPNKAGDKIEGTFDNADTSKTRIPFKTKDDAKLSFKVATDGTLSIVKPTKSIGIYYPYLSEGTIKTINLDTDPTKGVSGTASITPSVKIIKSIDLIFAANELKLSVPIDQKKLDPGIPGFKITEASIDIQLYPDFVPSGTLKFIIGSTAKPLADGTITVKGSATEGFVAVGDINAHVPGLDEAKGEVSYKKQEDGAYGWKGFVELKTSKIPRTKNVNIRADVSSKGFILSGGLSIDLPGAEGNEAALEFKWNSELKQRVLEGRASYQPPIKGVKPVNIHLVYDLNTDRLKGDGTTGINFKGLDGTFTVNYDNGTVWGSGDITFKKGRASGSLHVDVDKARKFTGKGTLSYDITPDLTVTGGIMIDEKQEITISGELEYKKPIEIFPAFKGDYTLLDFEKNIPVPGLSLAPDVGVMLKLTALLTAGYSLGPAGIKNIKVGGKLKPFEPDPDPSISAHADFYCDASAYIEGTLGGGVALSIFIAEVSGNIGVSAKAQLTGNANAGVDLKYEKDTFSADINLDARLALAIILALKAWVIARAGVSIFSVETRWDWTLAQYTYKPAFAQLGLKTKKPFHYDSHGGFSFPSASDLDITAPTIDPEDVAGSLFANASEQKKES